MSKRDGGFELPRNVERYLAALSGLYAQDGNRDLQEVVVNAQTRVHEEWSRDNWNGGTYGHALYLVLPEQIYLRIVRRKDEIQKQIREDLNKAHNVQNEFIEEVFLEMELTEPDDWRKDSGLLTTGRRAVSTDATNRIWGEGGFRVFLSHKSEVKKETSKLKEGLRLFGISCFVAHEDIHPTKEWQDEIENALASMDAFAALMTKDFHDSDWTDQEVGFAVGRGVPLLAANLGSVPYGFIGKFQALSCKWETAHVEIVRVLLKHQQMFSAFVRALRACPSWDSGNVLAKALPGLDGLASTQVDELVCAYNETSELRGSFGFNGTYARMHGPGLVHFLNQFGDRQFRYTDDHLIELVR